jgi:hypothetical protein
MSRRKGEITARMNERDYPHIVELPLPLGGFRSQSDAMLSNSTSREGAGECKEQKGAPTRAAINGHSVFATSGVAGG